MSLLYSFRCRFMLVVMMVWALSCIHCPLYAADVQEEAVVPIPAPVLPEQVEIKAEAQPAILPEKGMLSERLSILSHISVFSEQHGKMEASAVAEHLPAFKPYSKEWLAPYSGGLWMFLDLAEVKGFSPSMHWLDLGEQIPPSVAVWASLDGRNWSVAGNVSRGVYDLSSAGRYGKVLVRMEGQPGLWFRPVLSVPELIMSSPARFAFISSLCGMGLLGVLCLLLSLTEKSAARFWTGMLALASMAQMWWSVPSASPAGIFPSMFSAGVALFMLPHAGRVIMRTRTVSPWLDMLFLLIALPGACAAIVPLLPGMTWCVRILPLWPAAAIFCVFPSLLLLFRGERGSGAFFLACLFLGGGALASLWGILHSPESLWWEAVLYVGQTTGMLFLASAPLHDERHSEKQEEASMVPVLRSVEPRANIYRENSLAALRRAFRGTAEELFDEACRLDLALSRSGISDQKEGIMRHADAMVAAARRLSEKALDLPAESALPEASLQVFELRDVIQKSFSSVSDEAEKKGLGLSWYVAPQLGRKFKGDARRLMALLSLLLADAVHASSHGCVSLRVRRTMASTHAGHLQFSISDNGDAVPPRGRQSMLLARAWELASAHEGSFFVESTPGERCLSFSMNCAVMNEDEEALSTVQDQKKEGSKKSGIILVSPDGLSRQMYAYYLENMGHRLREAISAQEAASLYAASPAALVVFDGILGEDDMINGLASIRMFEGEREVAPVPFLLLACDSRQAERMSKAGCDEAIALPVVRKDLRAMARWLIDPSLKKPVLTPQRITLAAVLAGARSGELRMQPKAVGSLTAVALNGSCGRSRFSESRENEKAPAKDVLVLKEPSPGKKRTRWISSFFSGNEENALKGISDTVQNASQRGEEAEELRKEKLRSEDVTELSPENVLLAESGIQELTEDERVSHPGFQSSSTGEGEPLIELGAEFICESPVPEVRETAMDEKTQGDDRGGSAEGLDEKARSIYTMLDSIAVSFADGDVQGIRKGSRELAASAEECGMHTLADMARCFRAAWEEGDVDAAAEIIGEMKAEAARS